MKKRLHEMDFTIEATTVAKFGAFIDAQTALWTKIVKDNNIKSD